MAEQTEQLEFLWEGKDKKSGKATKGVFSAKSETVAKAELRRQGYRITKIKPKTKASIQKMKLKAITTGDIAVFARQLATMLKAGVPLVQSFDIVGKGADENSSTERASNEHQDGH